MPVYDATEAVTKQKVYESLNTIVLWSQSINILSH
jgi:hypothetical protein